MIAFPRWDVRRFAKSVYRSALGIAFHILKKWFASLHAHDAREQRVRCKLATLGEMMVFSAFCVGPPVLAPSNSFRRTSSQVFRQRLVAVARNPESQFCAHLLPEAVSGAAAALIGAVGGAIASAARILVSVS